MDFSLSQNPWMGNIIHQITGHVPPTETNKPQISNPFDTYLAWRRWPTFNDHDEAPEGDEGGRS